MKPIDYLILAIIAVIIGAALLYIRKNRKKGVKCIGCPDSAFCAAKNGQCACHCNKKECS